MAAGLDIKYSLMFSKKETKKGKTGNTVIRIPCNPEQYGFAREMDVESYNILGMGEVVKPKKMKLQTCEIVSYFPGKSTDPFALTEGSFQKPKFYIDKLTKWMRSGKPIRFIAARVYENDDAIFDTNIDVIITNFETVEQGGETGDFYYTLELQEYREALPKKVKKKKGKGNGKKKSTPKPKKKSKTGKLKVGDIVIANGKFWYTSGGTNPHGTAKNLKCKVGIIQKPPKSWQSHPIAIYTLKGGGLGWVKESQLKREDDGMSVPTRPKSKG